MVHQAAELDPPVNRKLDWRAISTKFRCVDKPRLLVCAYDTHPGGTETGIAFAWTTALSTLFEVHVICGPDSAALCQSSGLTNDWIFHPLDPPLKPVSGPLFYRFYHQWCKLLIPKCMDVIRQVGPVGLHHPSLGSFRMLPNYDRLPIPYTLGPLGGGEVGPLALLRGFFLPPKELAKEMIRPALNRVCLLNPQVRRVLRRARIVLGTTPETKALLRWAGARPTAAVFPQALDFSTSPPAPLDARRAQREQLKQNFRCVWSGRCLWWKGGQVALRFVHRLRQQGHNATLDIYSDGFALGSLKDLARELGLGESARFHGMVSRDELLRAYANSHLFVYPTLHDSSGSAIPEAYSTGLPSFTLALGGTSVSTDPLAGHNQTPPSMEVWLQEGLGMVNRWLKDPDLWLAACQAALTKVRDFSQAAVNEHARRLLLPCYGALRLGASED